jgi:hypothetical protein
MTNTETRSPFRGRGFIAAAVVIGVIVLAAIVVLVTSLMGGGDEPPVAAPTSAPSSTPTSSAADESICGLEGFDTENTLTAAPTTEWELVGTIAVPTDADGSGPGVVENGLRTCYAHTAEGALFMAVNYMAMGTDATLYDRLPQLIAPGAGREALEQAPAAPSTSSTRAQVAGYTISGYSPETTTVDLALNYSNGQLVSIPLKLVWVENDWKIVLTDAGELPIAPAPLDNLGGYTPWSGA